MLQYSLAWSTNIQFFVSLQKKKKHPILYVYKIFKYKL